MYACFLYLSPESITYLGEFYEKNDYELAARVEPLEQVIDEMLSDIKSRHIARLTGGDCTIELGFILSDLLNNYSRVSDHCSNIAACIIDTANDNLNIHEAVREIKGNKAQFEELYDIYSRRYSLPKNV